MSTRDWWILGAIGFALAVWAFTWGPFSAGDLDQEAAQDRGMSWQSCMQAEYTGDYTDPDYDPSRVNDPYGWQIANKKCSE